MCDLEFNYGDFFNTKAVIIAKSEQGKKLLSKHFGAGLPGIISITTKKTVGIDFEIFAKDQGCNVVVVYQV